MAGTTLLSADSPPKSSSSIAASFEGIVKQYPAGLLGRKRLQAVSNVSFEIRTGETFGLLGPNRAGKTTLVKVLLSLCRPTSGRAWRLGEPTERRGTLERVGYVHENPAFPRYLTATELLRFYGSLHDISTAKLKLVIPSLLERFGLVDRANEPISRFSKGMVQRLALAQALLNEPELLVLDEPNEGLDLLGKGMVADLIDDRKKAGRTTVLVSHAIAETERHYDRIAAIVGGRLSYLGPIAGLTRDGALSLEAALAELYRAGAAGGSSS